MATSLLHRTTIITVYKITPKSKLVDLIGLTNLKEKWVGLHLKAILLKSPFLVKIKSLCVNDFHVHKKDSLIFMYIKNKRLLTSVAKIRKVPIYFFYFWCMFVAILLFTACLYQILEKVGGGDRIPNSIMQSKKDQRKRERET